MPKNIESQIELFETAEYLGLDELKVLVVKEGLLKEKDFMKFTNVRRHYFDNIPEEYLMIVINFIFKTLDIRRITS